MMLYKKGYSKFFFNNNLISTEGFSIPMDKNAPSDLKKRDLWNGRL
jgi:hypothetical protein